MHNFSRQMTFSFVYKHIAQTPGANKKKGVMECNITQFTSVNRECKLLLYEERKNRR